MLSSKNRAFSVDALGLCGFDNIMFRAGFAHSDHAVQYDVVSRITKFDGASLRFSKLPGIHPLGRDQRPPVFR